MRRHLAQIYSAFLLISFFTLAFTGCGSVSGNSPNPTPTPIVNPSPTPTASPTPSPTPTPVASSAQVVYEASITCTSGNKNCADGNSTDGIYAYRMNPNGEVSDVPGSPFFTHSNSFFVSALPSGKFVYAVDSVVQSGGIQMINHGTNDIVTFQPDPVTGALSKVASTPLSARPQDVIMHPSGKFLYVFTLSQGILAFAIDQNSGALTPIPIPASLSSNLETESMVMDPQGKLLYAATSGGILGFHIDATTGALTPVSGSPVTFPNTMFLTDLAMHPSGRFLYVTTVGINDVIKPFGFSIDANTGALTPLTDPVLTNNTSGKALTVFGFVKDGSLAYATGPDGGITVASVDTSTGVLTVADFIASPQTGDVGFVTDPTGQFLYMDGQGITGFEIHGDGTPVLLPGFPHGKGFGPSQHGIAIAPLP